MLLLNSTVESGLIASTASTKNPKPVSIIPVGTALLDADFSPPAKLYIA